MQAEVFGHEYLDATRRSKKKTSGRFFGKTMMKYGWHRIGNAKPMLMYWSDSYRPASPVEFCIAWF
jgi:hypothetical protein